MLSRPCYNNTVEVLLLSLFVEINFILRCIVLLPNFYLKVIYLKKLSTKWGFSRRYPFPPAWATRKFFNATFQTFYSSESWRCILGRNWDKILRHLLHAIHSHLPPIWFSWTWDFYSKGLKWVGTWLCLHYLFLYLLKIALFFLLSHLIFFI